MILLGNIELLNEFYDFIEKSREELKERATKERLEVLEVEIYEKAVKLDKIANQPGVVKGNIQRVLAKRKDKKIAILNALTELMRCLIIIDKVAQAEGIKTNIEKIEDIKFKLNCIQCNLDVAKIILGLELHPHKMMVLVAPSLKSSSKQVDSLIDKNSRKLSRRVARFLEIYKKEMKKIEKIKADTEDGILMPLEDDTDYVEFTKDRILKVFGWIEQVIDKELEKYPE